MSLRKLYSEESSMNRSDWWAASQQLLALLAVSIFAGMLIHRAFGHLIPSLGRLGDIVAILSLFLSVAVIWSWPFADIWDHISRKLGVDDLDDLQ
jgi:predicted Na+-dependent transporter